MKAPKKKRGRPEKPPSERRGANITFRTPGGLRDGLAQSAAKTGRSISEEVVHRLERSFQAEDVLAQVLGGAEFRTMAVQLAAAFSRGARHEAGLEGHPEFSAQQLLTSPRCYRAGMFDIIRDMLKAMPLSTTEDVPEQAAMLREVFRMQLDSELIRRGVLKFDFDDGRGPVGSGFLAPKDNQK